MCIVMAEAEKYPALCVVLSVGSKEELWRCNTIRRAMYSLNIHANALDANVNLTQHLQWSSAKQLCR